MHDAILEAHAVEVGIELVMADDARPVEGRVVAFHEEVPRRRNSRPDGRDRAVDVLERRVDAVGSALRLGEL